MNDQPYLPLVFEDATLLDHIGLPMRVRNTFARENIKTVGDLRAFSLADIGQFYGIGRKSLRLLADVFHATLGWELP